MTITKANYLGIIVNDIAAATAFYRDTLGLVVDEAESIPGYFTQFQLAGDTTLALQAVSEAPDGQLFQPGVLVDDIDTLYAEWQAKGVELLGAPTDRPFGRTFLFRTPEGHVLRAYQYHQTAA